MLPVQPSGFGSGGEQAAKRLNVMYAVISSGGKQHRVTPGETLRLERLNAEPGETLDFDQVLMVGDGERVEVGTPLIDGARVTAEVLGHGRGDKVRIIKLNRRKHYRRQAGHRQHYTEVAIRDITGRASAQEQG